MTNYRRAFGITLVAAAALAAGLGYTLWRYLPRRPAAAASGAAMPGTAMGGAAAAAPPVALAPVQLSPQRLQRIDVKLGRVRREAVEDTMRAVGTVAVDERRVSYVQLRFSGWIQHVFANSTYQYVRRGEPLFTIYSPELATTEREYLLARRNRQLLAASTVPGVAAGAASLEQSALARLGQWQVPARELARLRSSGRASSQLEVDAPTSGYVINYNALPQMYAVPQTRLYTLADLSRIWVLADLYQNQIAGVRRGDRATVTVDTFPGAAVQGRVDFVYPNVDPATRTVQVRLAFANPGVRLKPGMYVNVALRRELGRRLTIPSGGVLQTGTRAIAFVDRGGGYLEPRTVRLGPQAGGRTVVLSGLKAGERVVTSANFLIDSESQLQAALGSFLPPPPGAGAAAAMNAKQPRLALTTAPAPPRKGTNTLTVTLSDAQGRAVAGAAVAVTFAMAAMPAMGMAAQHASATLADQGGGRYRGTVVLPSAGVWTVTLVARRGGRVIASRQLSLSATGGM
jgi:RND family efflux transporter MFP subunit